MTHTHKKNPAPVFGAGSIPDLSDFCASRDACARSRAYFNFGRSFVIRDMNPPLFFFGSTFLNGSSAPFLLNHICCPMDSTLNTK